MTYGIEVKYFHFLHIDYIDLTLGDLNTDVDELKIRWNVHHVFYDTWISGVNPSSNSLPWYGAWRSGIFDQFHQYKIN